jgi:hypothetical protein
MKHRLHRGSAAVVLTIAAAFLLQARPALAQGPYGRNSYEDFPFNQGSLFYRPLKPKPKPRARVVPRTVAPAPAPAPAPGGYGSAQPYTNAPRQPGYTYTYPRTYSYTPQTRYYYPTAPTYRVAPPAAAAAPATAAPPATAVPAAPR